MPAVRGNGMPIVCRNAGCGKPFEPLKRTHRYCSDECRHAARLKGQAAYRVREKAGDREFPQIRNVVELGRALQHVSVLQRNENVADYQTVARGLDKHIDQLIKAVPRVTCNDNFLQALRNNATPSREQTRERDNVNASDEIAKREV